jgi:hypothetical protein
MKSFRLAIAAALALTIGIVLFDVTAATAMSCDSTCNQIRRACRSVAMATLKVGYADCDDDRDACWTACEANAQQCPVDCDTAYQTCVGSGGTTCDADLAQCLDDCAHCKSNCNAARVTCRDAAKLARSEANLLCDAVRESCDTQCVDPIDPACIRTCRTDSSDCESDAKRDEKTCRATTCSNGTGQQACARACRRAKNAALALCSDQEVLCIGGCAGLTP